MYIHIHVYIYIPSTLTPAVRKSGLLIISFESGSPVQINRPSRSRFMYWAAQVNSPLFDSHFGGFLGLYHHGTKLVIVFGSDLRA